MSFLGLDIGGANLKVADGAGYAASVKLPIWRRPEQLEEELRRLIANAPDLPRLAITMTAELADCFDGKVEGVTAVLDAVDAAAAGRPVRVYRNDGRLVSPPVIRTKPLSAAATNWHALGRFAARWRGDGLGMLIDVGSSTCDVIPLLDPDDFPAAHTDAERLALGELVYQGVERTPVCAVISELPFKDGWCSVARELFATTLDVSLLLKQIPEDPANTDTADGRPATKSAARRRMSRMICANDDEFNHRDAVKMAQAVFDAQTALLAGAMQQVADRVGAPGRVIFSGHGEQLGRAALARCGWEVETLSLGLHLGVAISRCAPAHALAVLANESMAR